MKRLTTDNPQNNTETMLNFAYVENRWVKIRGLEKSFMQYIMDQCQHQGCDLSKMYDDELCEVVCNCAFSNHECPIFMLFTTATQAAELRGRLEEYEDTMNNFLCLPLKVNVPTPKNADWQLLN